MIKMDMMKPKVLFAICMTMLMTVSLVSAQTVPVVLQAESGIPGTDFRITDTLGARCIAINNNAVNSLNPATENRVITFNVTFPDTGRYDLYARVLVGPNAFNDDSYYYARSFGTKNAGSDADWIRSNGLAAAGFTSTLEVVYGQGSAGSGIWKWLNFSTNAEGNGTGVSFRVDSGALTQTFQIGGRETGFYIDKIAFAKSGLYFTVGNLNRAEPGSTEWPEEPIGTPIAAGQSKFLGSEWDYGQSAYFTYYWNQITPGNAGKWGSVEGTRDVMNWSVLDSTYHVSRRYKFPFKEHTLIWGAQQPSWIGALDSAQQRQEIEEWFAALANRYDTIEYIDVVNEPIHNAPNGMVPWGTTVPNVNYAGALGGAGTSGWDWIINSFRLARQYFPDSKLILNEYSVINSTTTTQQMVQIVNLLKAENLIDGIGEQGHAFTTYNTPVTTMKNNLDLLAATGIPLYITELDIDGPTDLQQVKEMQRVFPLFWEHPLVAGITLWGYRYGVWRQEEKAYLINSDDTERPALKWLKAYVNDTLILTDSIMVSSQNEIDSVYKGDQLQMQAQVFPANTTLSDVTWSVSPANLASIDQSGLLTTTGAGKVTITATAWDGTEKTGSKQIVILNRLVENISISATAGKDSIYTGENLQMSALVLPDNATNKAVTWSVIPTGIAAISTGGLLSGTNAGLVKVIATAKDGSEVADTMEIAIVNRLVESITLTSHNNLDSIPVNSVLQITATVLPLNATNTTYTWSLEPSGMAQINASGLLSALSAGSLSIIASANDASGVSDTLHIVMYDLPDAANLPFAQNVRIYPNPSVGGHFNISGITSVHTIEILDLHGKIVGSFKNNGLSSTDFDLLPGIYLVRMSDGIHTGILKITAQ